MPPLEWLELNFRTLTKDFQSNLMLAFISVTEYHFWLNFSQFSGTLRKIEIILSQLLRVSLSMQNLTVLLLIQEHE